MIERQNLRERLPLIQLNIYLTGDGSLVCQHCLPSMQPVITAGTVGNGINGTAIHGAAHNGNGNGKSPGAALAAAAASAAKPEWMALQTLHQAVGEALPLGLEMVRLCGGTTLAGDPLQYPEFDALLDLLDRQELRTVVETAGEGLTPALAARLARQPRCGATIGLDGANAATHDALRGRPGSFDTASSAAQMLAEQGVAIEIVFSVQRRNAGQIPEMVRLAERLGAQSLRFVFACPIAARMSSPSSLHVTAARGDLLARQSTALAVEELIAIGRKVDRELSRGTRVRLLFDQPPAFRGLHPSAGVEDLGRCGILNTLGVLPGGAYALCGVALPHATAAPELVLGRVGENALERVWYHHTTLAMLREGLPDRLRGVCERCTIKNACMGYCPTENYLRAGSFWSPYWFCEAADGVSLFPASRLIEV